MRNLSILAALLLAVALAGCAGHKLKPEGASLDATHAWLRLAEADQATATASAAKLAPGQFAFFKTEAGEAVMVTCEAPERFAVLLPDRAGELINISADAERDGNTLRVLRADKIGWPTPLAKTHAAIIYGQITAELVTAPANTPFFVE